MTRKLLMGIGAAAVVLSLAGCDAADRIGRDESKSPRTAQAPEYPPGAVRDRSSALPPSRDAGNPPLTPEERKPR